MKNDMVRGTHRQLGRPEMVIFYGTGRKPLAEGREARIVPIRDGYRAVDPRTNEAIAAWGAAGKYWAVREG